MYEYMLRNGKPFPMQNLKVIKGSIPKSILGSYIKNGPGLLTMGDQVLPHWFVGNSGLLKLEFHDGNAFAKYNMVETPAYKRDLAAKNFNRPNPIYGLLKSYIGIKFDPALQNSASTSVLRLPNSDKFYALYEGGLPYEMEEKLLTENDFTNFGFVSKGFSAHPKIDPDNGDIYNIGFNMGSFDIYRMTKDFKLIAKNNVKLRVNQSIHDCCLAGDYLVVFENPLKIDMWKLIKGYEPLKCYSVDYNYGKMIAYIFKKDSLELIKRIEVSGPQAFIIYHFTNGYTENNKIYVEYAKYPGQNAQKLLDFVDYAPNFAVKGGEKRKFNAESELETLEISLEDFSYKFSSKNIDCEFPICEDSEVGKKWRYSYFISKEKGAEFYDFNRLVRYDRINDEMQTRHFPGCCIVEPALIHTEEGLFILILKSSPQRCSVEILGGEKFQTVAEIQLPEYIPFGFHGRWIDMENKNTLETANWQK